ncbi:MAG: hypothetical protein MZW92_05185 [Comamonadaceae bacterium]|nr:hypothetical protein [Comamonadaceae bacterium]
MRVTPPEPPPTPATAASSKPLHRRCSSKPTAIVTNLLFYTSLLAQSATPRVFRPALCPPASRNAVFDLSAARIAEICRLPTRRCPRSPSPAAPTPASPARINALAAPQPARLRQQDAGAHPADQLLRAAADAAAISSTCRATATRRCRERVRRQWDGLLGALPARRRAAGRAWCLIMDARAIR